MLYATDEGGKSGESVQLNQNALQMYSTLMSMGFEDTITIKAANKYPNDAQQAIEWIMTQYGPQSTPKGPFQTSVQPSPPISSAFASQNQPVSTESASDLDSWTTKHNLDSMTLAALKQNGVDSVDDLRLLETEEEINELVSDLGLKIMRRKKLVIAMRSQYSPSDPYQKHVQQPQKSDKSYKETESKKDLLDSS